MVEYITRSQTACAVGATELVDNFEDTTPGAILAPTGKIGFLLVVYNPLFNAENESIHLGLKLEGEGIVGAPIRIAAAGAAVGASGTGEDSEVGMNPVVIPVDIRANLGKGVRIFALIAGTSAVTANVAVTMVWV